MTDVTQAEKLRALAGRLRERMAQVCEIVPPIDPDCAYWLDSDAGPSYCRRCVMIARGKEFDLGSPLKDEMSSWRNDWEDAFFDGIDGGFDTTSDSTAACDICGRTLSYILTDYGVEQELQYYREAPLASVRDEDSYALDRLTLNIWEGSPRHMLLGAAMAVNQAWRLTTAIRARAERGM